MNIDDDSARSWPSEQRFGAILKTRRDEFEESRLDAQRGRLGANQRTDALQGDAHSGSREPWANRTSSSRHGFLSVSLLLDRSFRGRLLIENIGKAEELMSLIRIG